MSKQPTRTKHIFECTDGGVYIRSKPCEPHPKSSLCTCTAPKMPGFSNADLQNILLECVQTEFITKLQNERKAMAKPRTKPAHQPQCGTKDDPRLKKRRRPEPKPPLYQSPPTSHELERLALQHLDTDRQNPAIASVQTAAMKAIAYSLLALVRLLREMDVGDE